MNSLTTSPAGRRWVKVCLVASLVAAAAALTVTVQAQTHRLNDTGITQCSDDNGPATPDVAADGGSHPRQDCRYGRDPAAAIGMAKTGGGGAGFDFTKIANNGTALPANAELGSNATDWACTRDNVTGLVWEVKTTSGLRNSNYTYTWYNPDPATNGGSVGYESGGNCADSGRCDTAKFVADVNAQGLCGASDWRMPTRMELLSIVDFGRSSPAIDPTYFPNTLSLYHFWSSSPSAYNLGAAWCVTFFYGLPNGNVERYDPNYVRLVRSGQ